MFELIVLVVVVAFVCAVALPRYLRTRRALNEPIGGDRCVACQSTDVTEHAPQCYRCAGCGFTWGDGIAALAQAQRAQKIAQLDPTERRSFAAAELREAETRLLAADAALENAGKQLVPDLLLGGGFGSGDMYSRTRNEGIVNATGEMGIAQKHIRNAAEAMEWKLQGGAQPLDFHSELFALDVHFESMILDVANHLKVNKLKGQAAQMRQAVAQALGALK